MRHADYIPLCTIAGSDPTGGAGLQGDLKTFAAHGVVGTAVVTAVTVQGRRGVTAGRGRSRRTWWASSWTSSSTRSAPPALKTGMLWDAGIIRAVASRLAGLRAPCVVDPVLAATAGGDLLHPEALTALREDLIPLAHVITPNLLEGARLLDSGAIADGDLVEAARALLDARAPGGAPQGGARRRRRGRRRPRDRRRGRRILRLPRLQGANAHGTGCALARLARGPPRARRSRSPRRPREPRPTCIAPWRLRPRGATAEPSSTPSEVDRAVPIGTPGFARERALGTLPRPRACGLHGR